MDVKKVLGSLNFSPSEEETNELNREMRIFTSALDKSIRKLRLNAEIFVGGSFAKDTLVRKDKYDIDIFVRFDWRIDDMSDLLEKAVKDACQNLKIKWERVHGSRDYFQAYYNDKIIFEIIPIARIKNPREERNVTDLSYFHVNYVRKNLRKNKIGREIVLAKAFCRAQGVYGAESYINGFSGYGLECLLIYYKTFEKMARDLAKVKERIILDPAKHYRKKEDILRSISESKLQSPIVLIDPTWKERNVLAALSGETFHKFQNCLKEFLRNPSVTFFIPKKTEESEMKSEAKKNNSELAHLRLNTEYQAGDIAGTKLKKFFNLLSEETEKAFFLVKKEFIYDEQQSADFFFITKPKHEIIKIGPPITMKRSVAAFRKSNKRTFIKDGVVHAKIELPKSARIYASQWMKKNSKKMKEMGITGVKIF